MKRLAASVALIASIGGCGSPESPPEPPLPSPITWEAPASVTVIDLGKSESTSKNSPTTARWMGSLVVVKTDKTALLTGQKIGPRQIITAGHAFDSISIYPGAPLKNCGPVEITDQSINGLPPKTHKADSVGGAQVGYDFVSMRLADGEADLTGPYVPFADVRKLKPGDEVTIAAFRPSHYNEINRHPTSQDKKLRQPETREGVVLGVEDSQQLALLTDLDGRVVMGNSGGGAFVEEGTLGVISRTRESQPLKDIEHEFNVDIQGTSNEEFQITYIQPATDSTMQVAAQNPAVRTGC